MRQTKQTSSPGPFVGSFGSGADGDKLVSRPFNLTTYGLYAIVSGPIKSAVGWLNTIIHYKTMVEISGFSDGYFNISVGLFQVDNPLTFLYVAPYYAVDIGTLNYEFSISISQTNVGKYWRSILRPGNLITNDTSVDTANVLDLTKNYQLCVYYIINHTTGGRALKAGPGFLSVNEPTLIPVVP